MRRVRSLTPRAPLKSHRRLSPDHITRPRQTSASGKLPSSLNSCAAGARLPIPCPVVCCLPSLFYTLLSVMCTLVDAYPSPFQCAIVLLRASPSLAQHPLRLDRSLPLSQSVTSRTPPRSSRRIGDHEWTVFKAMGGFTAQQGRRPGQPPPIVRLLPHVPLFLDSLSRIVSSLQGRCAAACRLWGSAGVSRENPAGA